MKRALVFLAEGFEEIEALSQIDILRRGGVDVTSVALADIPIVKGSRNISVAPDTSLGAISDLLSFDAFILPGGLGGMKNLCASDKVLSLLQRANDAGRIIAAICAAPIVLDKAGVIGERSFTCYPSCEEEISSGNYTDEQDVVVDGNLITSRGPATAMAFALAILRELTDNSTAQNVADGLLADL